MLATTQPLLEHIKSELDLMEQFLFSLQKENALLLENYNNDDLFDLTELKNHYADQLNGVALLRDSALVELQLPTGREGLLAAQAQYKELDEAITALFETAETARKYNEENGLLIQTYLDYSTKAIEALNSVNPTAGTSVYDAKGKAHLAGSKLKRGIVRA